MKQPHFFTLLGKLGDARAGRLLTSHGEILTPVFMPVGTQGTVKAVDNRELQDLGAQIILGNTYHLFLRPGMQTMQEMGGLHQFMGWHKPILTDSGGYQVSSLGLFKNNQHLSVVDEEGVTFKSHIDGSTKRLTPQKAIEIQETIGADIIMAFDEATPDRGKRYAREAMERTHRWLSICRDTWQQKEQQKKELKRGLPQSLFGIIQGGDYQDLRQESAAWVTALNLPGVAVGGASVGQSIEQTELNMSYLRDLLPDNKPRYLMGVGVSPRAAVAAVMSGADMFDCVAPTRLARCGLLYTGKLKVSREVPPVFHWVSEDPNDRMTIEKQRYARDKQPIETGCDCYTCTHGFSRGYLHHLFKCRELLYYRLASIHNLRMIVRAVQEVRQAIIELGGCEAAPSMAKIEPYVQGTETRQKHHLE